MVVLRYEFILASRETETVLSARPDPALNAPSELVAFYDDGAETVYLSNDWDPRAVADISVLIHEMVHHLQGAADLDHACPGEREKLAYQAQAVWLGLFGRSLETEFGIDAMTLLVTTSCVF